MLPEEEVAQDVKAIKLALSVGVILLAIIVGQLAAIAWILS
jgi:hypothetical protein